MSRHMSTVAQTDLSSDSMFPNAMIISCLLPTGVSVLTQAYLLLFYLDTLKLMYTLKELSPEALNKGSGRSLLVSSPTSFDFLKVPHLLI